MIVLVTRTVVESRQPTSLAKVKTNVHSAESETVLRTRGTIHSESRYRKRPRVDMRGAVVDQFGD
jgi:hypothetical protein